MNLCRTCACWQPLPESEQKEGIPQKGHCYLNPPVMFQLPENMVRSQRPITFEGEHCFQHVAKLKVKR